MAFKDIMETRKIFSRFFAVDGCRLRLGVYESFDTLCIYLESDALGAGPERNYWVKYRIAALNQKHYDRTDWKESSICTKSWNNSVLQLMKVTSGVDCTGPALCPWAGWILPMANAMDRTPPPPPPPVLRRKWLQGGCLTAF